MKKGLFHFVAAFTLLLGAAGVGGQAVAADQDYAKMPDKWPAKYTFREYAQEVTLPNGDARLRVIKLSDFPDGADFSKLPFQYSFVRVFGNGERKLAVFSDPNCRATQHWERWANKNLKNTTVYTFVAPLLNKDDTFSQQFVCQPTNQAKARAWENWYLAGIKPPKVANCKDPGPKAIIRMLTGQIVSTGRNLGTVSPVMIGESNRIGTGAITDNNMSILQKTKDY